jgi:hypothetical protein
MYSLIEERYCVHCSKIKPSSEFEESTKIWLHTYRLSWFKMTLSNIKEDSRFWLEDFPNQDVFWWKRTGEEDEEIITSSKRDLRTADDILRIVEAVELLDKNTAHAVKAHWIEIPITDYQSG